MSAISSFSESSKYVQKPINWYGRNSICACSAYVCTGLPSSVCVVGCAFVMAVSVYQISKTKTEI